MGYELETVINFKSSGKHLVSESADFFVTISSDSIILYRDQVSKILALRRGHRGACLSGGKLFVIYRDGKLLIFNLLTESEEALVDIESHPREIFCCSEGSLLIRWKDESQVFDFSGNTISIIRCHIEEKIILFGVDYKILVHMNSGSIFFQVKHQLEQISHEFQGDFILSSADIVGYNIFLTCTAGKIHGFDCRDWSKLTHFMSCDIPSKEFPTDMFVLENLNRVLLLYPKRVILFNPENRAFDEIQIACSSGAGEFLISESCVFRVNEWLDSKQLDLTELVQRNSPLDALKTKLTSPKEKIQPKKVLFHEKVKSSNYGNITPKRKMFQPILNTKRKSKIINRRESVKERNFGYPGGDVVGQTNGTFFESMPTLSLTSHSSNTFFVDSSNVLAMKKDFSTKLICSVSASICDISFSNEFLAVASPRGVSIWAKSDSSKPKSVLTEGAEIILPVGPNLSFCSISGKQLNFIKFELGKKTVLDSRGIGKGKCVHSHSIQNCHQITAACNKPGLDYITLATSDSCLQVFDLKSARKAASLEDSHLGRIHWAKMFDENLLLATGLKTGTLLYDLRTFQRPQRKFDFGPVCNRSRPALSYHSQYLLTGSDQTGKQPVVTCFDVCDTRPVYQTKLKSPSHLHSFNSTSNFATVVDLEKNIFLLN